MNPCVHAERLLGLSLKGVDLLMYFPDRDTAVPHENPVVARFVAVGAVLDFACQSDGGVGPPPADYAEGEISPVGASFKWGHWKVFPSNTRAVVTGVQPLVDGVGPYGCVLSLANGNSIELRNQGDELEVEFRGAEEHHRD